MTSKIHFAASAIRHPREAIRRAFTLVELLVVIGIIAVLISILLPAMSRARQQANLTACMANLRSIGQAMNIYAAYYQQSLPFGYWDGDGDFNKATDWRALLQTVLTKQSGNTYVDSAKAGGDMSAIANAMFVCKDVPENVGVLTYSCHPRLMPQIGANITDPLGYLSAVFKVKMKPYKIGKIRRASEIVLIADGSLRPLADFNMRMQANVGFSNFDHGAFGGLGCRSYFLDDQGRPSVLKVDAGSFCDPTPPLGVQYANTDSNSPTDFNIWMNIRFRHVKNTTANVLMVDGHVENAKISSDKKTCTLRRLNVDVNPH